MSEEEIIKYLLLNDGRVIKQVFPKIDYSKYDYNLEVTQEYIIDSGIKKLLEENTQLKLEKEEAIKSISHYVYERDVLKQQLKDKDEKISKAIEYCNEKLKWNRDDGNDYWAGKNNAQQQVSSDIKDILESNKED